MGTGENLTASERVQRLQTALQGVAGDGGGGGRRARRTPPHEPGAPRAEGDSARVTDFAEQPYTLYEALFSRLLARCRQRAPRHGFRFKNTLHAIDATTIDVCLTAFPWASFRRTRGAIKLHVGLDQAGHLPSFLRVTDGKAADVTVARTWTFPAGSVVVADRAYLDFKWLHHLHERGVTFVTRLKRGVKYRVLRDHDVDIRTGVMSDQTTCGRHGAALARSTGGRAGRTAAARDPDRVVVGSLAGLIPTSRKFQQSFSLNS